MTAPSSTWLYRLIHIENLDTCIQQGGLFAPNHLPDASLPWRAIHNVEVQAKRQDRVVDAGPGGTLQDYVPFYFGKRGPMLLNLHTDRVSGYSGGQRPILYLVASAEEVVARGLGFVFYDGHALASFSSVFDDLARLDSLDWEAIRARQWQDSETDNDRQRRKQAEFLVYRSLPWDLVRGIATIDNAMKTQVNQIQESHPEDKRKEVGVRRDWYYR